MTMMTMVLSALLRRWWASISRHRNRHRNSKLTSQAFTQSIWPPPDAMRACGSTFISGHASRSPRPRLTLVVGLMRWTTSTLRRSGRIRVSSSSSTAGQTLWQRVSWVQAPMVSADCGAAFKGSTQTGRQRSVEATEDRRPSILGSPA